MHPPPRGHCLSSKVTAVLAGRCVKDCVCAPLHEHVGATAVPAPSCDPACCMSHPQQMAAWLFLLFLL